MNHTNEIASRDFSLSATTRHQFHQSHQSHQAHQALQLHQSYSLPHLPQRTNPLDLHAPVLTLFGDLVDVRKRGALRIMSMAGAQQGRELDTPAVVRLWHDEQCRELSAGQARALAEQLQAAADLADSQNRRV